MINCEVLVIGGSAGSLDVLLETLPQLELNDKFAVVIVLHRKKDMSSALPELFAMKGISKVSEAEEKEQIIPGNVYIAPADYHLLIEKNRTFSLDHSEKINFCRPSIDATFETAADAYGSGVVAVLLSGSNADGVNGMRIIQQHEGTLVVQTPESAKVPIMPQSAISALPVDYKVAASDLANFIKKLA